MGETTTPAVGNELFVHNMRALWRIDPGLALLVDAVPDEDRIPIQQTKSSHWTASLPTPTGTKIYLHSRYDPVVEAERFAASVPIEDKFCLVVSGLGLGYHVKAIFERLRGDCFVLCGEPSIPMIATALTCVDLAGPIAANRLIFLVDNDKARLHERLRDQSSVMMLGAQFVQHAPSLRIAEQAHATITTAITEFVSYTRMTLVTLVANSQITCKNIAMNLVNYVSTPPIDGLRDRFKGKPGIVISAGPSLRKNIDLLVKLKGLAVTCAVQTAVRPLMERGFVPDFITSLDFHEMSRKFFDEVGDLRGAHLIAEPKATWHVVDEYRGPVSLLDNAWARLLIGDELAARGGLKAGATVAHLAFYLAVYLGCDPIIFVGQDLAFTGHVFYIPGVEVHQTWRNELNRYCSMEQKEWERIARNRPILQQVESVDGGKIYSDELLTTYLEQFEKDIAQVPRRIIDATEGGAKIRGAELMRLCDVANRFCREPIDPQCYAYHDAAKGVDPTVLPRTAHELQQRIEELTGVVTLCDELLKLLAELETLTGDPRRFNQRLVRVDELRTKVQQERRAYQIVNSFTQHAELRRFSADRKISTLEVEGGELAKQRIARDIEFISGVRDGAVAVAPIIKDALKRVRNAVKPA